MLARLLGLNHQSRELHAWSFLTDHLGHKSHVKLEWAVASDDKLLHHNRPGHISVDLTDHGIFVSSCHMVQAV